VCGGEVDISVYGSRGWIRQTKTFEDAKEVRNYEEGLKEEKWRDIEGSSARYRPKPA